MKKLSLLIISVIMLSLPAFAQKDTVKTTEVGFVFSNLNSFGLCFKTGNQNTLFRIMTVANTGSSSVGNYKNVSSNGNVDTVSPSPSNAFSLSLNVGMEKRDYIGKRFCLYYGLSLIGSFSTTNTTTTTPSTNYLDYFNSSDVWTIQTANVNNTAVTRTMSYSGGIGVVCGFSCKMNRHFRVSAELIPSCTYNYTDTKTQSTTQILDMMPQGKGYTPSIATYYGAKELMTKGFSYSLLNNNAAIIIAYRIK